MNRPSSYEEFSKMRQQLNRIEEQIIKSQQLFTQDITIDNKCGQEISLTINLEDRQIGSEKIDFQSRIAVPNNSSVKHKITQQNIDKKLFSEDDPHLSYIDDREQKNNDFLSSSKNIKKNLISSRQYEMGNNLSSTRLQQKFQPVGILKDGNELNYSLSSKQALYLHNGESKNLINLKKSHYGNEIYVADDEDNEREIKGNEEINRLTQSKYIKNVLIPRIDDQNVINKEIQHTPIKHNQYGTTPITLPYTIQSKQSKFKSNRETSFKDREKSEITKQQMKWSLNNLEKSSLKKPTRQLNFDWKIQKITPSPKKPLFLKENNRNYTQRSIEKKQFERKKKLQRQNRFTERLLTSSHVFANKSKASQRDRKSRQRTQSSKNVKLNKKQQQKNNPKIADDLFLKRKKECLNNIQKQRNLINLIRKHQRQSSVSKNKTKIIQFVTEPRRPERKQRISPKIEEISNRLHSSKGKSPCAHYNKFSQSLQRQKFNLMVRQNLFVSRYINHSQREQLFQRLRQEDDSVSFWPMKIVSYTYTKLKRLKNHTEVSDLY